MNKKQNLNLDYLKRCKKSTPEKKFEWLENALNFAQAKKIIAIKK